jgi:hypothetical protein
LFPAMLAAVMQIDVLCCVHFVSLRMMNSALQICTEQLFKFLITNKLVKKPIQYIQLGEAICPTHAEIFLKYF